MASGSSSARGPIVNRSATARKVEAGPDARYCCLLNQRNSCPAPGSRPLTRSRSATTGNTLTNSDSSSPNQPVKPWSNPPSPWPPRSPNSRRSRLASSRCRLATGTLDRFCAVSQSTSVKQRKRSGSRLKRPTANFSCNWWSSGCSPLTCVTSTYVCGTRRLPDSTNRPASTFNAESAVPASTKHSTGIRQSVRPNRLACRERVTMDLTSCTKIVNPEKTAITVLDSCSSVLLTLLPPLVSASVDPTINRALNHAPDISCPVATGVHSRH